MVSFTSMSFESEQNNSLYGLKLQRNRLAAKPIAFTTREGRISSVEAQADFEDLFATVARSLDDMLNPVMPRPSPPKRSPITPIWGDGQRLRSPRAPLGSLRRSESRASM